MNPEWLELCEPVWQEYSNYKNYDKMEKRLISRFSSYPGSPPASILLARVTSFDQTSYCHLRSPNTPQSTLPECIPTRIFKLTSVASTTAL